MELKRECDDLNDFIEGAFNQTRMELKHQRAWEKANPKKAFNQTRMELKQSHDTKFDIDLCSFNQTRMELKL